MKPLVIAHRGASAEVSENTLPALRRARSQGADLIEVDVHATEDGVVVVHHDPDLLRSAGVAQRIDESRYAAICRIPLTYGGTQAHELPTLAQALAAAAPVPLVVEIKPQRFCFHALTASVVAALEAEQPAGRSYIISFDGRIVEAARLALGSERVGLIRDPALGPECWREIPEFGAGVAVLDRTLARPAIVSELTSAGAQVWIYAVDDPAEMTFWLEAGAAGIISNCPAVARSAVDQRS